MQWDVPKAYPDYSRLSKTNPRSANLILEIKAMQLDVYKSIFLTLKTFNFIFVLLYTGISNDMVAIWSHLERI